MNTALNIVQPLPAILDRADPARPHRRHSANGYALAAAEIDRFNALLARLGRSEPLDSDQVAAAARELCGRSVYDGAAPCIRARLRRLAMVDRMLGDRQWDQDGPAHETGRLVVAYARGRDDLIPDYVPQVGRLDDAIVLETAWPQLVDEVDEYLDYCRLRAIEAHLRERAVAGFRFSRRDWAEARQAERALAEHQRRVRMSSYLPRGVALFQVH